MKITNSRHAFEILKKNLISDSEEFWAIALSSTKRVIAIRMLFRGTVDSCLVHPRDIFRFAVLNNASSLILAHNHPSGDHLPSKEDIEVTRRLVEVGLLMQIPIIDHLILGDEAYTSLAELGFSDSLTLQ